MLALPVEAAKDPQPQTKLTQRPRNHLNVVLIDDFLKATSAKVNILRVQPSVCLSRDLSPLTPTTSIVNIYVIFPNLLKQHFKNIFFFPPLTQASPPLPHYFGALPGASSGDEGRGRLPRGRAREGGGRRGWVRGSDALAAPGFWIWVRSGWGRGGSGGQSSFHPGHFMRVKLNIC